jgi:hypothetical protein
VIVFKRNKCYVLYEPALGTGANRKLSDSIGCVAHNTIAETPYGTIFLAADGPKITDGQTIRDAAPQLRELFQRLSSADLHPQVHGAYHADRYYLSGLDSSIFPPILEWDIKRDSWWFHGLGANGTVRSRAMVSFVRSIDANSFEPVLWVAGDGSQDNNYRGLYEFMRRTSGYPTGDERVSDGVNAAFPWRVESSFHTFRQPNIEKRIRELRTDIDLRTGPLTVSMAFTPSTSPTTLAEVIFEDLDGSPGERRYFTPGHGRACAVRMSAFAADSELFGYTLAADLRAN